MIQTGKTAKEVKIINDHTYRIAVNAFAWGKKTKGPLFGQRFLIDNDLNPQIIY